MQKQIERGGSNKKQFQAGSLEQQDNLLISMLQSDKIIDIGIFVCFLGVVILGFCCYLLEGHLRFHLSVILFLMLGLGVSLFIYKCLNSVKQTQSTNENQSQNTTQDQKNYKNAKQQAKKCEKDE